VLFKLHANLYIKCKEPVCMLTVQNPITCGTSSHLTNQKIWPFGSWANTLLQNISSYGAEYLEKACISIGKNMLSARVFSMSTVLNEGQGAASMQLRNSKFTIWAL